MVDINKRLVEVDEVLDHLSYEDLEKIPEDIKNLIKENKDKEYIWYYDETKPLKDQGLSRDTIAIISYLNMEYLLNEEQKKLMEQIHELNEQKQEKEKREKYDAKDLFKNKQQININDEKDIENKQITVLKESFFTKIINKLKSFFKSK